MGGFVRMTEFWRLTEEQLKNKVQSLRLISVILLCFNMILIVSFVFTWAFTTMVVLPGVLLMFIIINGFVLTITVCGCVMMSCTLYLEMK